MLSLQLALLGLLQVRLRLLPLLLSWMLLLGVLPGQLWAGLALRGGLFAITIFVSCNTYKKILCVIRHSAALVGHYLLWYLTVGC